MASTILIRSIWSLTSAYPWSEGASVCVRRQPMLARDGTLHYSDLRQFARSAAHYKHQIAVEREATRAMRVGTCVHHLVLGEREDRPLAVFPGDVRRGKEWNAFAESNRAAEVVTQPEMDDAKPIASAGQWDPHSAKCH